MSNECPSKVREKAFLKSLTYIHIGAMLTIIKVFISYSYSVCGNREHSVNLQTKSVCKLSFQLSFHIYILLVQTEGERETFFGKVQEGGPHCKTITWLIEIRNEI